MPKIGDIKTERTPDGKMQWTSVYTSSGWKASKATPVSGPKNTRDSASPAAAAAVVGAVRNLTNKVGSAVDTVKFGGKSGGGNKSNGGSSTPAAASPAGSSGAASGGSSAPAKPKSTKAKPGSVYTKTRAAYKSEKDNAPNRYETPEQTKARMDKSQFDMSMSGADVKRYRAAYLKKHPAAAKAVAKGTLSMGDINMTVRRLKKKGSMGAFGMKSEDAG